MKNFTKVTNRISVYVSYLSMAAAVFIMLYMTLDVILRHLFNAPITGGFEISTMAMVVLIFTSWSFTQTVNGHIHVTMLIRKFPTVPRFVVFGLTSLLSAVVMGIGTYAAALMSIQQYNKNMCTGMLLLPHWPFGVIECIALGFFTLILLRDAIRAFLAIGNDEIAEEITSHWT